MVPNLHRVVAELAFEDLAWWTENAGAGEEAVPTDGDGDVGTIAGGGATGGDGTAKVTADGAFSLDYCLWGGVLGSLVVLGWDGLVKYLASQNDVLATDDV